VDDFRIRDGELHCEEVSLAEIAAAVRTPVYVYSTSAMCRNAAGLADALEGVDNPLIAYAVKANSNAAVVATLAAAGLGADVVSGGEYRRSRAAGVAPDKIVFSGVGKTEAEMALALSGGLFQFNVESFEEAETLSAVATQMGLTAPVAFRVNPSVGAGGHAKITTGAAENKFGIPIGDAAEIYARAAKLPGLNIQGVAVHIGSQLASLEPLEEAFAKIGDLIAQLRSNGHRIDTADLGGGLGVPYNPDLPPPPKPEDYAAMVRRATSGWDVRLLFEPGRLIVASAGVLLSRVIRVKPGAEHPFVIVDAAMNDLMRPALYEAWHDVLPVRERGVADTYDIVGPVCETGDFLARERRLAACEGDLLAIMSAGAYGMSMASNYNTRPRAAEVMIEADRVYLIREREQVHDLFAHEHRLPL